MNDDSASEDASSPADSPQHVDLQNGQQPSEISSQPVSATAQTEATPQKDKAIENARVGGWRNTFSSLSNRNFLYLWLGMMTMMAGMQMQMLARSYLVFDLTGSASLLGIVSAGSAVPMLTLALFGGAIADRIERKRIIQVGQIIAALLSLVVAFAITTGNIAWYHLLITSFVQGSVFAFMMPARQAIIPQLVGKEQLTNAMALNAAAMAAMTLVAPPIAGIMYAWVGPDKVYFLITALGFLAVIFTSLIPKVSVATRKSKEPVIKDIIAGLSYVRSNRIVMVLLLMGLITTLLAQPFRFLMPVFVVDVYHKGPESMGLLVAVMGGGSLVGSLFIAGLGKWKRGFLLIMGSFASGIGLLLIAAIPVYFAAAAIMLLIGLGDAARRTLNQSLIMEETEDQYRGRVMSVFMMNFGLMPLGVLPTGLLIDAVGGQMAIGILAVLLLIVTTIILVTQKALRSMQ